jgi:hypothetical protein
MTRLTMHAAGPVGRIARMFLLSYLAAACSTWRVQPEPRAVLAPQQVARVSMTDGSRVYLRDVRVRSDTLFGRTESADSLRVAIPMATVRTIELQESNTGHVIAMTGGVLLGTVILTAAVVLIGLSRMGP